MTEQSNSGPSWARKTQRATGTNWGRNILIVLACIAAPAILGSILNGGRTSSPYPPSAGAPTGIRYGGFGAPSREQTATFLNALDNTLDADAKNFDREAKDAVNAQSLNPETLFRPGGIAAAQGALKREREVVEKYQSLAQQRKADGRVKLASLYTDDDDRKQSLAEFDTEVAASDVTMDQYWRLQFDIVNEEDALVAYLARERGLWRPERGKVIFLSPSLISGYQREVNDLRATSAQIKDLVAQINAQNEQARAARRSKLGQ